MGIFSGGDSGGPLTAQRNGQSILVGITSFAAANGCELSIESVFTRVGSYLDWLKVNTNITIS